MNTTPTHTPGRSDEELPDLHQTQGPPATWAELAKATWFAIPQSALGTPQDQPPLAGYLVVLPAHRQTPENTTTTARIQVNTATRTVAVAGRPLQFTRLEFDLLAHLAAHPLQVHTREMLYSALWDTRTAAADHRTVDVHIARLRRKLGSPHRTAIETVRGVGYRYIDA
ncbi:winged helix-turn-helix domain-containing protein [Streptomyces sp. NPDC004111]|uniref:winged helix-turn-helix domain-containing protein n=1 Tax=Streptomyces sp. NPDC004111 TaxID=3364690 RepID=UPI003696455F